MGVPKSFQQLLKFKAKSSKAVSASSSSGLILTPEFQEEQKQKKKAMLEFANQLRCPLCQAQLDGEVNPKKATLYCRGDIDHYNAEYNEQKQLKHCKYYFAFNQNAYNIVADFIDPLTARIMVFKLDLTISPEYRNIYRRELFRFIGTPPNFDLQMTEDELLDELKLFALLG